MMREWFLTSGFKLFHLVVEEEVNQDGVDVSIRVQSLYFPTNQLNTPNAASCFKLAQGTLHRVMETHLEAEPPSSLRFLSSSCP